MLKHACRLVINLERGVGLEKMDLYLLIVNLKKEAGLRKTGMLLEILRAQKILRILWLLCQCKTMRMNLPGDRTAPFSAIQ
jgi:hypothetical protein